MSVSKALEHSASAFNRKYACHFSFATFESRVEEFTFLRPNGGWIDVYKMTFDRMYNKALEGVATGRVDNLDGEAMLDDFEYMLIKPYVKESDNEIKHKPYAGMDSVTRLAYLDALTKQAPQTPVELYSNKYKNREISLGQMMSAQSIKDSEREHYVEISAYVQAIELVNQGRSAIWRALHPVKSNEEKRDAARMKSSLIQEVGGEEVYRELAKAACEPFEGFQRVRANLNASMVRAEEEMRRLQKLNDVMRESIHIEGLDNAPEHDRSLRADSRITLAREKQI